MITIFNRKELLVTLDPAVRNRAENVLKSHGIEYRCFQEDSAGGSSLGSGRARGIPSVIRHWIYRIYVKKDASKYVALAYEIDESYTLTIKAKQIASSVGEGVKALLSAYAYLKK